MQNHPQANSQKTLRLVQFALLLAIEALFCFVPLLGSIPFTPNIVATLSHIPVIVAAILLGTGAGAAMGFAFGLFSFLVWTFMTPNPIMAFVFTPVYAPGNVWSLVICFVPRILIGVVVGLSARLFVRLFRNKMLAYGLAGLLGSLTSTLLVILGIYVFFAPAFAEAFDTSVNTLMAFLAAGILLPNGVPEAILGAVTGSAVCRPLEKILFRT